MPVMVDVGTEGSGLLRRIFGRVLSHRKIWCCDTLTCCDCGDKIVLVSWPVPKSRILGSSRSIEGEGIEVEQLSASTY